MRVFRALSILCVIFCIAGMPVRVYGEEDKHVILIDPGHGGIDGGAHSKSGTIEKDINLQISNKLKECLESEGYSVHMTRSEDTQLDKKKAKDLTDRCNMKKDTGCEIFISIHQNMFPQASCFGAQVLYSSNDKSKLLAEYVQSALKESISDNNKRIEKPAKEQYKILRDGYDGACILVECGFLSNPEEERRLKDDEHQNKIVEGIKCGVNKYFEGNS